MVPGSRRFVVAGVIVALFIGAIEACSSSSSPLKECDDGACDAPDGSADGSGDGSQGDGSNLVDGGDGGNTVDAPPGCTLGDDPRDSPPCVDDSVGVFVSPEGKDTNNGMKGSPYLTIGYALQHLRGKPRVYICAGTYVENVSMTATQNASIYGGFDCGSWGYSDAGTNAVAVSPTIADYAIQISGVTGALQVEDIAFTAPDGTAANVNSIAAFVSNSPNVTMKRVSLTAQTAFQGVDQVQGAMGALMTSTPTPSSADGNIGGANDGGVEQDCTCLNGGTSKGGKGGDNVAGNASNGADGQTAQATPSPAGHTGTGSTSSDCSMNSTGGKAGSDAPNPSDAPGATSLGTLSAAGWSPMAGSTGAPGQAGQGGGGGGANAGGGGGGACGGCGGAGGAGGGGGGASVALLSVSSTITVVASTFQAGQGGNGGAGGAGGAGVSGGTGGNRGGSACLGGNGGMGANGGAGGGGAGGVSAGIFYTGTPPSYGSDSSVTASATTASGGTGAGAANNGVVGMSAPTLAAP